MECVGWKCSNRFAHLAAASERDTAYRRNDGNPGRFDCGDDGEKIRSTAHGMAVGHLLDVCSGAEGIAPSRDDDERDGTVILGLLESFQYADTHVVA